MNKFYRYFAVILLVAMCLTALAACTGNDNPADNNIAVTAVKLNKDSLTLEVGESEKLTVSVEPTNAADCTVSWSTSNAAVATVSDGTVRAVAAGTAVITAKAGEKSASCTVAVNQPVRYTLTEAEWKAAFEDFQKNCKNFSYASSMDGMSDKMCATEQYLYATTADSYYVGSCIVKRSYGWELYNYDRDEGKWYSMGPNTGGDGIESDIEGRFEQYYSAYKELLIETLSDILAQEEEFTTFAEIAAVLYDKCTYNEITQEYECDIPQDEGGVEHICVSFDADKALSTIRVTAINGEQKDEWLSFYDIGTTKIEEKDLPFDVNESDIFVKALSEAIKDDEIIETLVEYFHVRPYDIPNEIKFSAMFGKCTYNDVEKRYEYTRTPNDQPFDEDFIFTVYIALDENNNLSYIRAFKQSGEETIEEINLGNNDPADDDIAVTAVKLNKDSLVLKVGGSEKLTVSVEPTNAADRTVSWSTSNAAVATVSDGNVTAVAAGTAVITAKAGEKSASCTVTVNQPNTRTVTKEEWKTAIDEFFAKANNFSVQFENQAGGLPMEKYDLKITDSVIYGIRGIDDFEDLVCMIKTVTGESERVTGYLYNNNFKQWFQTTYDWNPSSGKEIDEEVASFKEEYIKQALLLYLAVYNNSDEETMDLVYNFFDQCTVNSETGRYEAAINVEDAPGTTLKFTFGFENKVLTYLDLTLDLTVDNVTNTMVKLHVYDVGITKQDEALLPDLRPANNEVSGMTKEQWKTALKDFFESCNSYSLMTQDLPVQGGSSNSLRTQLCNKDAIYLEVINYEEKNLVYILRREGSFEEFIFDYEKNVWRSCGATDNGEIPDDVGTFFDNILQGTKDQLRIISNSILGGFLTDAFDLFEYDVKEKTFAVYSARIGGFIQVKFVDGALSSITIQTEDMLFKIYDIGTTVVNVPFEQPVHYTLTEAEWKAAFEDFEKNCKNFSYAWSMDGVNNMMYVTEQYLYATTTDSYYVGSCIVKRSYGWELYYYDTDEDKWISRGPNTGGDGIESNIEGMFEQYYSAYKDLIVYSLSDILAQDKEFTTLAEIAAVLYDKCTYNEITQEYECDIPQDEGGVEHICVSFDADKALSAIRVTAINGEQKDEWLSFYNIGTTKIEEKDLPFDVNESDIFVKALSEAIKDDEIIETLVEYFHVRPQDIPNEVKFSAMFGKCTYNDVEKRYEYTRTPNDQPFDEDFIFTVYIALDENNNLSYLRAFRQNGEVISEEINIDNNGTHNANI